MENKNYKKISILLVVVIILTAGFICVLSSIFNGGVIFASEDNVEIKANLINKNTQTTYLYLNNITDIFLSNDGLYILDESGVYFKENGVNKPVLIEGANGYKIAKLNDRILILNSLGVFVLGESVPIISGSFYSMCVLNNSLYLLNSSQNAITQYDFNLDLESEQELDTSFKAFSVNISNVWDLSGLNSKVLGLTSTNACVALYWQSYGSYSFAILNGSSTREIVLEGIEDDIRFIYGFSSQDKLSVLTSTSILIYSNVFSGKIVLSKQIPFTNGRQFCINQSMIYVATSRSSVELISYGDDFSSSTTILGSRLNLDWFYSQPNSIFSRNELVLIADRLNNRIVQIDSLGLKNIGGVLSPISSASTKDGDIFVAHNSNEIKNLTSGVTLEIMPDVFPVPLIKKMTIDVNDNIYALVEAQSANYLIKVNSSVTGYDILPFENPLALGLKASGGACVLVNGKIYLVENESEPIIECGDLLDFALDYGDNVFGINLNGNLVRFYIENQVVKSEILNSSVKFDKLIINPTLIEGLAQFNDLLAINSTTHSLYYLSGVECKVKNVADYFPLDLNKINGNNAHLQRDNLLARANAKAYLYARAVESEINYTLNANDKFFVRLDILAPDDMYFAVCENLTTSSLSYGYIYKKYVDLDSFSYTPSEDIFAKITAPNVDIKKYPSIFSANVATFYSGDVVTILDFYSDYSDCDNKKWRRISLANGTEGYILLQYISISLFTNDTRQTDFNAIVINDTVAYIYEASTGEYIFFKDVKQGVNVLVKDFDRRQEYTEVIFYIDDQLVDIKCYIKTVDLEYDGLDTVQIVAMCVIAFTLLLATILTIALSKKRK